MYSEAIFKANDIRGVYPSEINEEAVEKIGRAYALVAQAQKIVIGEDVHLCSQPLKKALVEGLVKSGVEVVDIGLISTEELYFASGHFKLDAIQVTASHLPREYGGLKMVQKGAVPITSEQLQQIKELVVKDELPKQDKVGSYEKRDIREEYLNKVGEFADFKSNLAIKLVANANFGLNGQLAVRLLERLGAQNIELIKLNFEPNGNFPKGRPDPLVEENRQEISETIRKYNADGGVAWDADGDRCYLIDENGEFVEGCHLSAIIAKYLLSQNPGGKIIYESRNRWAIEETVRSNGGVPILSRTGHTFIKQAMRSHNAIFGGEMSGHFYYRDFFYADSGLVSFVVILNILSQENKPVSQIVEPMRQNYAVSGEYNFVISHKEKVLKMVEELYQEGKIDKFEGLSISFDDWRFNLRASNTEDLLRLNVEAKNQQVCLDRLSELKSLIEKIGEKISQS